MTIPMDVLLAECKAPVMSAPPARVGQGPALTFRLPVKWRLSSMGRQARLSLPKRLYAGAGGLLQELAADRHPVLSQMWDRGDFSRTFPEYVGVASAEVNGAMSLFNEADVVLTVGAGLTIAWATGSPGLSGGDRVHSDRCRPRRGRRGVRPVLGMAADPYLALRDHQLCAGVGLAAPRLACSGAVGPGRIPPALAGLRLGRWEPPACYPPLPGD